MRRSVILIIAGALALTGCATGGGTASADDDTLAGTMVRWDAAVAAGDADALTVAARAIPWHVVRDCGPQLDTATREAIVAEGEAALDALADAEQRQDSPLAASAVLDEVADYIESVRRTCL